MTVTKRADSIAIIGAGASGSVALDVVIKEQSFSKIKLFERRSKNGGVWILDEASDEIDVAPGSNELDNDKLIEIPDGLEINGKEIITERSTIPRFILTPSYANIRTNVPEHFMTFSDKPKWPVLDKPDQDPFTSRDYVEQYLEEYIEPNLKYVQYNTTLEKVDKTENSFILTLRKEDIINNKLVDIWWKEEFDALILATGHYHIPHIPDVIGLKEIKVKYPNTIKYAKQFRNDDFYKDKTVLVIGGSASGIDISNVLSRYSKKVYRSEGNPVIKARHTLKSVEIKPIIEKYILKDDGFDVLFEDGSILSNPDYIIYGTGYEYSYPFLRHLYPNFSNGAYLPSNYQHTFHIDDLKISTLGVPIGALSFRAFEYQSILISRYLAGKIDLPSVEEQYEWVKNREVELGKNRRYHRIGTENVVNYLNDLTKLGGGVNKIGEFGREFPVITQQQVDDWNEKRTEILAKLEESPGGVNTWEVIS